MKERTVGEYIRRLRKSEKLSLVELSKLSGVSNPYISQIENNKFIPSPDVLKKLSIGLNVSYDELLERAGYIVKTDLEKLDKAITELESSLYSRYTHKKYWDSLSLDSEQRKKAENAYDNNQKLINAYELNLLRLKELRAQVALGKKTLGEEIENIDELMRGLRHPKNLGLEFEIPDFSKLTIPKLTNEQAEQMKKITHTFVFEVPASVESFANGKSFIMPIPKKAAERSFYDVANLLNLSDKINLNGRTLSPNDIEKILSKIDEIKDEFEYQD